jgi:nitrogen-specific signal transduction histidine kinase
LIAIWQRWFELVFREGLSQELLGYLWRSGLRHAESDIDQRLINLGYAFVRQFCQDVATAEVPSSERENVLVELDKLIDFCALIESHAFITATSQCDMEVVKGISHQVRNPLTVIGGNILRLKRKVTPGSPLEEIYDTILNENRRLEKMVVDVGVYSDMLQRAGPPTTRKSRTSLCRSIRPSP